MSCLEQEADQRRQKVSLPEINGSEKPLIGITRSAAGVSPTG